MISAHFLTINLIVVMISGIDTVYALQEGLSRGTLGTILQKLDLAWRTVPNFLANITLEHT